MVHPEFRHGGKRRSQIPEGNDQGGRGLRRGDNLQRQLRNDAEGALRTDHQVHEGVAGRGFGHGGAHAGDFSAREHHRHGPDVIPGGPVFNGAHAAGVRRHVGADAGELLARIGGIHHAPGETVRRQVGQQDAGFDIYDEVFQIVGQDPVHL